MQLSSVDPIYSQTLGFDHADHLMCAFGVGITASRAIIESVIDDGASVEVGALMR